MVFRDGMQVLHVVPLLSRWPDGRRPSGKALASAHLLLIQELLALMFRALGANLVINLRGSQGARNGITLFFTLSLLQTRTARDTSLV